MRAVPHDVEGEVGDEPLLDGSLLPLQTDVRLEMSHCWTAACSRCKRT